MPKLGDKPPGGGDYMIMYTRVLAGDDGMGRDIDMAQFTGPNDMRAFFGCTDDLTGCLGRWLAAIVAAGLMVGCRGEQAATPPGVLSISVEKQSAWVRNFNPLAPGEGARFPTRAGVYEPLLIFNTVRGEYVPWLATSYAWSPDHMTLRFALRVPHEVLFSPRLQQVDKNLVLPKASTGDNPIYNTASLKVAA